MKKIRAAIVGYGNIGKYVLEALEAAPDFEVAGIIRRNPNDIPDELKAYTVTDSITKLDKVDVAVLATPTRSVEEHAKEILALGINTVDSFDIHGGIVDLRRSLDAVAKAHNTVAVISAGWDPGSDSVVRALLSDGAERYYLYELRSGYEYGAYGCREGYRRREGGFKYDDSFGNRCTPSYGLYRGRRRIRFQASVCRYQGG